MYRKQSRLAKSKPNGTLYSIQESSAHKLKNKTTEESSNDKLSSMSNVGSLFLTSRRMGLQDLLT